MIKILNKHKYIKHKKTISFCVALAMTFVTLSSSVSTIYASSLTKQGGTTRKYDENHDGTGAKPGNDKITPIPTLPELQFPTIPPEFLPTKVPTLEDLLTPEPSPITPGPTKSLIQEKESIMKGFAKFKPQIFKWPKNLTVGGLAFSLAESLYTQRRSDTKEPIYWENDMNTMEMQDYYASNMWKTMPGMMDTIEVAKFCQAVLEPEVAVYEEIMDDAVEKAGVGSYKEIFKAIAQTRFNEKPQKEAYEKLKEKKKIEGKGTDPFDLFKINGSWIDGGQNPIQANETGPSRYPKEKYTVAESTKIAAEEFAHIVNRACFPSPYSTETLLGVVQSFEFGGNSGKIQRRVYDSQYEIFHDLDFVPFEINYSVIMFPDDSPGMKPEVKPDNNKKPMTPEKIIEEYAKCISHGTTRGEDDKEVFGKYQYTDQKFHEKVFQNYKCSGGGSIEMGNLPEHMKELLRKCMAGWDSRVTKERREIIQHAVSLYGATYTMSGQGSVKNEPWRNTPSVQKPEYLDCSSFCGQAYWRAGILPEKAAWWLTGDFASNFKQISESEIIPGDIAQKAWHPGKGGSDEHIGLYIGEADGSHCYIHCTSTLPDGSSGRQKGKGVVVQNNYPTFKYFGRCPQLN